MSDISTDLLAETKNNRPIGLDLDDSSGRRRHRADSSNLPGRSDATAREAGIRSAINHEASLTGNLSCSAPFSKRVNFFKCGINFLH